jgi:hypothetical protein
MGFSTTNTWPNNPQPNPWQAVINHQTSDNFAPNFGAKYFITAASDHNKLLTLDGSGQVYAAGYDGGLSQQFRFTHDHNKFCLISEGQNKPLALSNAHDGGQVTVGPNHFKEISFEIIKNTVGEWAGKGYIIKDNSGKYALDLTSESVPHGSKVVVWTVHNGANQTWRIIPVETYNT